MRLLSITSFDRKRAVTAAVFCAAIAVVLMFFSGSRTVVAAPLPAADYIVVYKASVADSSSATDRRAAKQGFIAKFKYGSALKGFAATLTAAQASRLAADANVDFIQRDTQMYASGYVPLLAGDAMPTGIRRTAAGIASPSSQVHATANANVAVIDTGINLKHPDLNVGTGKNCISSSSSATADDDNGHGSHVAGTIAAKNNGSGVTGVAPGTRVHPVKVLNSSGSGSTAQVICGIDWVAQNAASLNIKVANMSLGGSGSNDNNCGNTNNDAQHKAVCRLTAAGVTLVVAAGNSNVNFATSTPASYPEALTVTALSDSDGLPGALGPAPSCRSGELDDRPASFSNFAVAASEQAHTIAAPGVCIYSTSKKSGGGWFSKTKYNNYATLSGTSMASPHMAGSVALCIGNGGLPGPCAGMTPAQVVQKMRVDAAARTTATPSYGFTGDPLHSPIAGKVFDFMQWDGGY